MNTIDLFIVRPVCDAADPFIAVLGEQPDLTIRCCTDQVDTALAQLRKLPCAVILVSHNLAADAALELTRTLVAAGHASKVLVVDVPKDEESILQYIEEGAAGYVCVDESWADLVKKIRAVAEDEFILHPDIAAMLMSRIAELKQLLIELDGGSMVRPETVYADLTQRELEVLRLLGQDMSNQEIAQALTIELGTVKNHVHNLLRKLDVCSRKHAAQLARQMLEQTPPLRR